MKLKILILIILALFVVGCAEEQQSDSDDGTTTQSTPAPQQPTPAPTPPPVTAPPPTPAPIPAPAPQPQPDTSTDTSSDTPPPPELVTVKFAAHISSDLYFYKSGALDLWKSGSILKLGPMEFSVDDTIYTLDIEGNESSTDTLLKTPTAIKRTSEGVYWCYQYSESESSAMGGQYKIYSEFYLDDNIISAWYLNKYQCRDILSVGSNVWSINENGARTLISGSATNVMYVQDNEFFIHSQNSINKTIMFGIYPEDYELNYILNATEWLDSSGDYYSGNGYIWSESGRLREQSTSLNDFNAYPYPIVPEPIYGQAPVVIAAGKHAGKLYWIELNSGWLFDYDPSSDTLNQSFRLYIGDGMHSTGIEKKPFLSPFISEGILYFTDSGSIFEIDLSTGFQNIFYGGYGEVMKYE